MTQGLIDTMSSDARKGRALIVALCGDDEKPRLWQSGVSDFCRTQIPLQGLHFKRVNSLNRESSDKFVTELSGEFSVSRLSTLIFSTKTYEKAIDVISSFLGEAIASRGPLMMNFALRRCHQRWCLERFFCWLWLFGLIKVRDEVKASDFLGTVELNGVIIMR